MSLEAKDLKSEIEVWKVLPDTDSFYDVSSLGRVRSWKNGRHGRRASAVVLTPTSDRGYQQVSISVGGKATVSRVHQLVMRAFSPKPSSRGRIEIAHLSGDRSDNRFSNLKWASKKENESHKLLHGTVPRGSAHANSKLDERHIQLIRMLRDPRRPTYKEIGLILGVSASVVEGITNKTRWAHVSDSKGVLAWA